MNKLAIILILVSISSCVFSTNKKENNLPVIDVYIESLCPDCMDFIGGSFKNFHLSAEHDQLAVVNFYPFGNANEKWNGSSWEFTCQHGANECYGNTVETCALNRLGKNEGHDLLICVEGNIRQLSKDFVKTLEHCVSDANLRTDILNCASSQEGNQLEHQVAQATPTHNYVPWVHFNGEHNVDIENKILSNMLEFLCDLRGDYSLKACSQVLRMSSTHLASNKRCLNTFHHYTHRDLEFLQ
jgi:interferon gamma-inducible protein 30